MTRTFPILTLMAIISAFFTAEPAQSGRAQGKNTVRRDFVVRIKNLMYDQKNITVTVGDTVTWINEDDVRHSVTKDTGSTVDQPEIVLDGGTFSSRVTFAKDGVFNYKCKFHSSMQGTITINK